MASILAEDAAAMPSSVSGVGLSFDVEVFRQYLKLLLPPGA